MADTHQYAVLYSGEVLRKIRDLRGKKRKSLETLFRKLEDSQFPQGDHHAKDETGRDLVLYVVDDLKVRTWHDLADNHLKVLSID